MDYPKLHLNVLNSEDRLNELIKIKGEADFPKPEPWCINNHIHTFYSFSPYSPTAAVYAARISGLTSAGIVDHDSVSGAKEFTAAGKILEIPTTIGAECRLSMKGTSLENRRTNNPDQVGISYFAFHGIPLGSIDRFDAFFRPLREIRKNRIMRMTTRCGDLLSDTGVSLDFEENVLPLSKFNNGGSITERHLLLALAKSIITHTGRGIRLIDFLLKQDIILSDKQIGMLWQTDSEFYEYDLLGVLKSAFLDLIYIPAAEECPTLTQANALAAETGAVLCYAYLGDVGNSVTGDKKAQKFEDDYIEELFDVLKSYNIQAVTYMLTRNTSKQLTKLRSLCRKFGMMEICGEDINSPRQKFVCPELKKPEYSNLVESTKMLVALSGKS